jgi:hypothetical protein
LQLLYLLHLRLILIVVSQGIQLNDRSIRDARQNHLDHMHHTAFAPLPYTRARSFD